MGKLAGGLPQRDTHRGPIPLRKHCFVVDSDSTNLFYAAARIRVRQLPTVTSNSNEPFAEEITIGGTLLYIYILFVTLMLVLLST